MKNKTRKCRIYKSCKYVPCGERMNNCRPSYCVPEYNSKSWVTARNWDYCNMGNWSIKNYKKYKKFCRDESKCKLIKTKKNTKAVDALILHNKMPYIWRHLKPNTRKYMVELAKKEVKEINIPFPLFPDSLKTISTKKSVNNIIKSLDKKNKKLFKTLRKKYKDI